MSSEPIRTKIEDEVRRWDAEMKCLPTKEEIFEFEIVRSEGKYNMFERDNVQRYAFETGLYHLVNWIERCKEHRISHLSMFNKAFAAAEKDYGPRATWITPEMRKKRKAAALIAKKDRLLAELRALGAEESELEDP